MQSIGNCDFHIRDSKILRNEIIIFGDISHGTSL